MERMNNYAKKHEETCRRNDMISPRLYEEYGVNLGLRDEKGNGGLTGLKGLPPQLCVFHGCDSFDVVWR